MTSNKGLASKAYWLVFLVFVTTGSNGQLEGELYDPLGSSNARNPTGRPSQDLGPDASYDDPLKSNIEQSPDMSRQDIVSGASNNAEGTNSRDLPNMPRQSASSGAGYNAEGTNSRDLPNMPRQSASSDASYDDQLMRSNTGQSPDMSRQGIVSGATNNAEGTNSRNFPNMPRQSVSSDTSISANGPSRGNLPSGSQGLSRGGTTIQEQVVMAGLPVVLSCYADNYMQQHPTTSVVWYRNDEPVDLRAYNRQLVNMADLQLMFVRAIDEGIYACAFEQSGQVTYNSVIVLKVNPILDHILDEDQIHLVHIFWPIGLPVLMLFAGLCSVRGEIKRYKRKGMPPEVLEEIKQRKLENKRKKEEAKREAKLQKKGKKKKGAAAKSAPAAAAPPPPDAGAGAPPPPPPSGPAPPPPPGPGGPPAPPGHMAPGPPPPGPPMAMAPGPPAPAGPQHEMIPTPMALMMRQGPPTFGQPPGPPPGMMGPPMAPPAGPPMAPPGPSGPPPPPPGGGGGRPPPAPPPPPPPK